LSCWPDRIAIHAVWRFKATVTIARCGTIGKYIGVIKAEINQQQHNLNSQDFIFISTNKRANNIA